MEAAWAYQHRPNVTGFLLRRQKNLALSDEVKKIAWKAQQRLHKRYKALAARGKNKNQIVTALGRELLGFIWAIGVRHRKATETRQSSINETRMFYWTAEPMTAQGPRKGEPSSSFYAERAPAPTRASSPRQLPTDHVHAVPTREYQSDQSSRMLLRCHRPCCPKPNTLQGPPAGTCSRSAARRMCPVDARTVLAVKGSLRRAKQRRALDCCAPFRPDVIATGGSGGNTSRTLHTQKQKAGFPPAEESRPENQNKPVRSRGA